MADLPRIGSLAPDFTLPDQNGTPHTLSDSRGKRALIYFYPKDDTPGCTKQACLLADAFPDFSKLDVTVFGISTDSIKSHKKFADKYHLPFTLLSDEKKEAVNAYGVWGLKKMMGREYEGTKRTSFLIAPDGTIERVYEDVKPEVHAANVLADIKVG